MIIKKCDVCKNEVDKLYDEDVVTHVDTISGNNCYKKERLHICITCMSSLRLATDACELEWYNDNIKENNVTPSEDAGEDNNGGSENEPNENEEEDSGHTGGTTTGE